MKSIIGYIKEGLSPAELADMIDGGVYEMDAFGRLKNEPINSCFEDRQRVLDSLRTLVLEAKSLEMPLAELVDKIEKKDTEGLDLGIMPLRGGVPAHWLDSVDDLESAYKKDSDDSIPAPSSNNGVLVVEFSPIQKNADDWAKVIYEFHNKHPHMDRPAIWEALYDGVKVKTKGGIFTVESRHNDLFLKEDGTRLSRKDFNRRWGRYLTNN